MYLNVMMVSFPLYTVFHKEGMLPADISYLFCDPQEGTADIRFYGSAHREEGQTENDPYRHSGRCWEPFQKMYFPVKISDIGGDQWCEPHIQNDGDRLQDKG